MAAWNPGGEKHSKGDGKFNSIYSQCQNHENITACETQFRRVDLLWFKSARLQHSCMQYVTRISNGDNALSKFLAQANHIFALWEQTVGLRR